ncbi:helix-turn-helix domain-containing protein [Lysinibacillus sp. UGB7]|uniref:helix-turn-helix domain-containing protein n=1 Tax=Lysinibacillus TaxID=400634 RepID=UPI003B7AEC2B
MFQISLKATRINAELEQADAAFKMGITAKTLRNYEKGITTIPELYYEKRQSSMAFLKRK